MLSFHQIYELPLDIASSNSDAKANKADKKREKAEKKERQTNSFIEPLHLVLIEEPEAHLHAQSQQVFIKKAYGVLRKRLK